MLQAHWRWDYTLAQVSEHFGVSDATISQAVKQVEKGEQKCQM
jgi:hypothetical protein